MPADRNHERLLAAMAEPSFYAHRVDAVELRETRISWIFLAGDRVYKVKKPITMPFLDYSTPERRRLMCEEEVRLNRRLAPAAYLAVRPIVRAGAGFALAPVGEESRAVEFAVEMRRLPEDRTLSRLLVAGELTSDQLQRVGHRLAMFHAEAKAVPEQSRGPTAVKRMLADEFETLLRLAGSLIERRTFAAAERFAAAFLVARNDELRERADRGRFREGHGDLRLEHVLVDGEVQAFDCVEFDPALRRIDVGADLAFLVMRSARPWNYTDGKLDAANWSSFRDELTAEAGAARAEVERLRDSESGVEQDCAVLDAEQETLERLAEIRRAMAGEVHDAESAEAVRAALSRLFSKFVLHPRHGARFEGEGRAELVDVADRYMVELEVRPQALVSYVSDEHPLLPVLRREPLPLPADKQHIGLPCRSRQGTVIAAAARAGARQLRASRPPIRPDPTGPTRIVG